MCYVWYPFGDSKGKDYRQEQEIEDAFLHSVLIRIQLKLPISLFDPLYIYTQFQQQQRERRKREKERDQISDHSLTQPPRPIDKLPSTSTRSVLSSLRQLPVNVWKYWNVFGERKEKNRTSTFAAAAVFFSTFSTVRNCQHGLCAEWRLGW